MSEDYIEPHCSRSHSSTAKLVHVPRRERRSKSVGRSFWSSLAKPFSHGEVSNNSPLSAGFKSSTSPSITSRRSLDLDSTADENLITKESLSRQSSASTASSISSMPTPLPRMTSLSRSQILNCNSGIVGVGGRPFVAEPKTINVSGRTVSVDSFDSISNNAKVNRSPKTKTTVIVHMRKNTRTDSASNSEDAWNHPSTPVPNKRITPVRNNTSQKRNAENVTKTPTFLNNESTHSSRHHLNPNFDNHFRERVQHRVKDNRNNISRSNMIPKRNRSFEDVHRGIPFAYPDQRSSQGNVSEFGRVESPWKSGRDKKDLFDRRLFKSQQDLAQLNQGAAQNDRFNKQMEKDKLELNSLQVFRQPKYRIRKKSEKNINHSHHLEQSEDCKELVKRLSQSFHPNVYENQNSLSVFQNELKTGFITSSRQRLPINNQFDSDPMFSGSKGNWTKEPIYAEIDESVPPEISFPSVQKRVTFSTTHQPFIENDLSNIKKKVLPATLWGIVEVKCALRERHDADRRSVAKLCYHAIKSAAPDHSIKVLGKIDRSRFGESVYVVLEDGNFEVRDGEGLIVSKHKPTDISVIQEIQDDPNLFIYIGRCKFGGRIGMVVRFNKPKHLKIIVDFFR